MLSFSKKSIFISAILSCLFATFSAHASVIILGTRLIYLGNQSSLNVQLNNQDSSLALVQSWIEDKQGSQAQVPFIITPPVTRVEGIKGKPCVLPLLAHKLYHKIANRFIILIYWILHPNQVKPFKRQPELFAVFGA